MTKEEAIKVLEMFLHKQCDLGRTEFAYDANTVWNAVYMASNALKQEPCEDAVSRRAALGALNCEISGSIESDIDLSKYKREFQEFANMILEAQEKAIQALPSVTPTRKVGKWNKGVKLSGLRVYICSNCGSYYPLPDGLNFCPNCGADMRGGEEGGNK